MPTWLIQKETQIYNWLGLISVLKINYMPETYVSEIFLLIFKGKSWTV